MEKPNILWICSDQQRWNTLGCYGNPFVLTPHIDRLAAEGVLFEMAFCQSPVCTPSRSSFMTGRYPHTTRCYQNGQNIQKDEVVVTRLLRDAGYRCGLSGKFHLAASNPLAAPVVEHRIDDGYEVFHWSHHSHNKSSWGRNNGYEAWLEDKGLKIELPDHPQSTHVQVGMPEEHHQTTWCVEKALEFIEDKSEQHQPWLFSINFFDPHHPFDPPADYLNRYQEKLATIPLPRYQPGELEHKPPYQEIDHGGAYGHTAGFAFEGMSYTDHRMVRAAYWAMCDLIDKQVGRLIQWLETNNQLDNTLIIYMSDHGEMLGDHGIYLKGPYCYDEAIRVPLILRYPKALKSRRETGLVELMDMAPTLLQAAGLPVYAGMHGRSLWKGLTGAEPLPEHEEVYCEYYNAMRWHQNPGARVTMVRTENHKLVVDHSHHSGELYDLQADPGEITNLWGRPENQAVQSDLLLRLAHRQAHSVDPLPKPMAPW